MNEEIELRHLRYFLAVAETLHFSQAAQRLGIAQPPLSQQIKRLEQLLGHRLFDRTTRGVKLTLAGQLLAERARSTLEKVHDDLAQVRRLGRGEEGTLTVGFSGSVTFADLPAAIESYRRRYPKVELRLRELVTSAQTAALLDGTIDLAFLRDGDPTAGIQMSTWLREPYVAVLPAAHALARKRSLRVKDLRDEPFILFARRMGPLAFDRTIACCEANRFRPNIVQDAPQWPTLVSLVAAGLGVSLAPACVANVAIPGAVYRDVNAACRTTIDLGIKAGSDKTLAKNFAEIAREHLAR
ncbi:MAG TPA: LysR substrate-binding domain-containing protein [Candidatus Acidoferrales bacterium]|jgi:DNA-binding transcriptional LysR family regulator|nr:LysR substrate-binding domain-containing protein [Candidatus Acidoferrales bacterium]